jgi:hypothetical protein
MSALDQNPSSVNLLSNLGYKLLIKKCPNVDYFIQKSNLPGIGSGSVPIPTPLATINHIPDHLTFEDFFVQFKVNEDLSNWLEIHDWMRGISPTSNFNEYVEEKRRGLRSDILLTVLNSSKNPLFIVTYQDAYPVSLSGLQFDSDANDVNFITATAVFKYTLYKIEKIK